MEMTTTNHDHRQGNAPARSNNSITLSIGLLTLPLSLYTALDKAAQPIERGEFTDTGSRVGRASIDKDTGDLYTGPVVKKALVPDTDTWVEITDDELAEATSLRKGHAEVECFIPLAAIGTTYLEDGRHQVRPAKVKQGSKRVDDPAAAKTFALVMDRLAARQEAALIRVAVRGPARWMALCPDGTLRVLAFARQVRQDLPAPTAAEQGIGDAERALADQLFDAIGVGTPVLEDPARDAAAAYVTAKAAGTPTVAVLETAPAPAVDLLAALQASVTAAA